MDEAIKDDGILAETFDGTYIRLEMSAASELTMTVAKVTMGGSITLTRIGTAGEPHSFTLSREAFDVLTAQYSAAVLSAAREYERQRSEAHVSDYAWR